MAQMMYRHIGVVNGLQVVFRIEYIPGFYRFSLLQYQIRSLQYIQGILHTLANRFTSVYQCIWLILFQNTH